MKTLLRTLLPAVLLAVAVPAHADEPAAPAPTTEFKAETPKDSEGFEKVDGSMMRGESIPANRLVAAAYGFIFAAVAVYAWSVASRARRVEEEMAELQRRLEGSGAGPGK